MSTLTHSLTSVQMTKDGIGNHSLVQS